MVTTLNTANTPKEKIQRENNKNSIRKQQLKQIIPTFSFERFRKHNSEKDQLKEIKKDHKKQLRKLGFNPKKRINVSEPINIKIECV